MTIPVVSEESRARARVDAELGGIGLVHRATQQASRVWFAFGTLPTLLSPWNMSMARVQDVRAPVQAVADASERSDWDLLCDGTLSEADRLAAADRVLAQHPLRLDQIAAEVRFPFAGKSGAVYLVRAIDRASEPPPELFEVVRARFEIADREELPALLGAAGSFATRQAAELAMSYLQDEGAVSAAAQAALARATGRDDLGSDRRAWATWLDDVRPLSDAQWSDELARRRGVQVRRLMQHERAVVARLVESLRRTHIETPENERAALLISYITDAIPEIRDLGFSLINRELGAGATLSPEVGQAALDLLAHPEARTRASAALLVNQLSPPGAETRILAALERETEALPASALLDAAARWATPSLVPYVLTWLTTIEDPAWKSATNALWGLSRAGSLSPAMQIEALELLRRAKNSELSTSACRFLGSAGDDEDRARLATLLEGETPSRRLAAAAALVPFSEYCDSIVRAAGNDDELFPLAARATLLHNPTLDGYLALHAVAPGAMEPRREGLLLVASSLPAVDLYSVAANCTNVEERTDLLEDLTSEERVMSERASEDNLQAMLRACSDLALIRLHADRAESALLLLDQFARLATDSSRSEISELQVAALLVMDRIELAEVLDAPASSWLLGLRFSARKPHAADLAATLEARFENSLTALEREELDQIKATIGQSTAVDTRRTSPSSLPKR